MFQTFRQLICIPFLLLFFALYFLAAFIGIISGVIGGEEVLNKIREKFFSFGK